MSGTALRNLIFASVSLLACGDDELPADAGADSGAECRGSDCGSGGGGGAGGSQASAGEDAGGGEADMRAVTLRFEAKVGDETLECGRTYSGLGKNGASGTPKDFRFFVEDVRLIARDGTEVPVVFDERAPGQTPDVALIDFADTRGKCGSGGSFTNRTITGRVPNGTYSGITFTNAVPESLNHQNIVLAKPPLQDASTYWGWASGYRFILVGLQTEPAGGADVLAADGGSPAAESTVLHIGAAGCAGSNMGGFTCARPYRNRVRLEEFEPDSSTIVADFGRVFANVDLASALECHGAEPECAPAYAAFGLNAADGAPLSSQQVFRVE